MSLHSDLMGEAGGEMLFDTNGDSAIYIADGGAEANLTALLGDAKVTERNGSQGKTKVITREITIWASVHAVYGGVVEPSLRGNVSIAGDLWSISSIAASSSNFWKLVIEKTGQRYLTRPQYFKE